MKFPERFPPSDSNSNQGNDLAQWVCPSREERDAAHGLHYYETHDIPCSFPKEHGDQEKKKLRRTHGLDASFSYRCPLFDGTQQHVVVSVKYSDDRYPTEGIRYEFAEYGTSQNKKAEFTHEIEISHLADKFKHVPKGVVKQPLQELVSRIVAEKFKERNKGNKSTLAATARSRPQKRRVAASPAAGTTVTPSASAQDLPFPAGF
jgi:hypothetical protein